MKDLKDKTAFVTGAGSGIGLATGRALAARGARLILADIDGLISANGAKRLNVSLG